MAGLFMRCCPYCDKPVVIGHSFGGELLHDNCYEQLCDDMHTSWNDDAYDETFDDVCDSTVESVRSTIAPPIIGY
jgi:hypothetical protein